MALEMSRPPWLRRVTSIAERHTQALGEEATQQLLELVRLYDGPPRIVNLGLLNAGKSSLFNAILQEPGRLKTGAARTTVSVEEVTWENGSVLLLDTPGLDALEGDTLKTARSSQAQDLVLFVHSLEQGDLDSREVEFLAMLAKEGVELDADHSVVVLTKADRKEPEEIQQIEARISEQWEAFLGVPTRFLCVSSEDFLEARAQGRTVRRQESSGIPALQSWLRSRLENLAVEREVRIWDKSLQRLRSIRQRIAARVDELEASVARVEHRASLERERSRNLASELFKAMDTEYRELP